MNEKEIEATTKALKNVQNGYAFWFCKEDDEGNPLLYVHKSASEIKSQVKDALAAKRVGSTTRVSGTISVQSGVLSFQVESSGDIEALEKGLTKLGKQEPFKKYLSDARVEAPVATEGGEEVSPKLQGLTLTVDSWKSATKIAFHKRSSTLVEVDRALDAWESSPGASPVLQLRTLLALKQANDAWRADKMGESKRLEASQALAKLIATDVERLKGVCLAEQQVVDLLTTPAGEDPDVENRRFEGPMNILSDYRLGGSPQCAAAKDHVTGVQALVYQRVDAIRKEAGKKKDAEDLKAILRMGILSKGTIHLVQQLRGGEKIDDGTLCDAIFDDFFRYGQRSFTYSTSVGGDADLLGGATKGACGTFAAAFSRLVNLVTGRKVSSTQKISARNFYTLPMDALGFIDVKCPGNLCMSEGESPSRYFFTEHWIAVAAGKQYDPTTGRKGGAVGAAVAADGFKGSLEAGYEKEDQIITVEKGAGYGGGGLYTLRSK